MSYKPHYGDSSKALRKKNSHSTRVSKKKKPGSCFHFLFRVVLFILFIGLGIKGIGFLYGGHSLFEPGEESQQEIVSKHSRSVVDSHPEEIPDYHGDDVILLHDNMPDFVEDDLSNIVGESYSNLDRLGRCGTAVARIDRAMMPTEKRGNIGSIKPTGWIQNKYPGLVRSNPPYLYNRCHLIAYAMTGQNANEKNLITGTRHMNTEVMLPYEKQILHYLDQSDNHVLYRVSPYFQGDDLLARGIELEAYSIEDQGEGICFHVFLYNVQSGVTIDYKTGNNYVK